MLSEIVDEMKAKISANCGMFLGAEEVREVLAVLASPEEIQASELGVETFVPSVQVPDEIPAEVAEELKAEEVAESELEPLEPDAEPEVFPKEELKGPLPEDFPGHTALEKAGIRTYSQLRKVGDLTVIDGIGDKLAEKIEEALKGN